MTSKLSTLLFIIFSTNIWAQEINYSIDTTLLIDDVIIMENRLKIPVTKNARSIEVVDRERINSLPVTNVPELLQYIGGADIRRRGVNGVQSDAGLRGGTFNQVLILINGVRMSDPQTGHHNMNLPVALEDIERVEVIKGPAARIFGMNAMTGAINIITKIDKSEKLELKSAANLSSFTTIGANVTATLNTNGLKQSLSLSRQGSEGYRENTDYGINTAFYQAKIDAIKIAPIAVQAGYTERKFGANGFYANEAFKDQYEEVRTGFVSANSIIGSGNFVFKPRLSWRTNKDEYVFLRHDPSYYMNTHKSNSYIGELHASYSTSLGTTGFGIDVTKETLSSNNLGERNRTILGLFLEQRMTFLNDKLGMTIGFYGNKISDYDFKIYPGIDLSYVLSPSVNLFASANWSDRIPTYTNLYYQSRAEQGNENLLPESALAYEAGVKYNTSVASVTASAYVRNSKNLIDWAKDSLNQEKWLALNFNEVNVKGFDITSSFDLAKMVSSPFKTRLNLSYSFIDAEVIDPEKVALSRYALENLSHQFIAGLQFEIIKDRLDYSTNVRYLDRPSEGTPLLDDYSLLDMKLTFKTRGFSAYVSVNNLTNSQYRETNLVPMPGRWYGVGVRFF